MTSQTSEMASDSFQDPATFIDLFSNSVILARLAPYLQLSSKLALTATCTSIQAILHDNPETFRYMDLSYIKSAKMPDSLFNAVGNPAPGANEWRRRRMDDGITEDEFYGGPLRGIFNRLENNGILNKIRILVLDGLCVTAQLVGEIISDNRFDIRILSIRQVTHMNDRQLQQVLDYAVRPSRPEGYPRLKGLYLFGKMRADSRLSRLAESPALRLHQDPASAPPGVTNSEGAQIGANWSQSEVLDYLWERSENQWYQPQGTIITPGRDAFAWTMIHCEGIIAFDAVLCRGPRHDITNIPAHAVEKFSVTEALLDPAIANVALGPKGCEGCGSIWEGPAVYGKSPSHHLPLLNPPPLHSSSVKEAQKPNCAVDKNYPPLFVRCRRCLADRYCERCGKFWDETCLPNAPDISQKSEVSERDVDAPSTSVVETDVKVHMGLCSEKCLVEEMMLGAGSSGMWG
ncbi:MAG: hypothetical protein M1831_000828 [Alyxoria varia]|nr:MAG: hypothetical protein M1831_000828 [Alyxoria varia]